MLNGKPRSRRGGFTLIELLVVIAIIGILIGLTAVGLSKVRQRARDATVVDDLQQITAACGTFKKDMGFNVPQAFTFPTVVNRSDPNYVLLTKMFRAWPPNRDAIPDGTSFASINLPPITFRGQNVGGQTIRGSQCLVFFLGGPNLLGFQKSGPYPAADNATARTGPYFDFKAARVDLPGDPDIFSYRDPYGTPYAFFSTGTSDRYDPNFALTIGQDIVHAYGTTQNGAASPSVKWLNMGGVQIISAGPDKRFGPGVVTNPGNPVTYTGWTPSNPAYTETNFGFDDRANFSSNLLGIEGGI